MFAFRAASLHDQDEGTEKQISVYQSHRDKIGMTVGFVVLAGVSYNFVATQSKCMYGERNSKKEEAALEQSHGYKEYQLYKASLTGEDLLHVNNFEDYFMKRATDKLFSCYSLPTWNNNPKATRRGETCSTCLS
jgi:hypothetical protein